jgi:hypothetical protein
MTFNDLLIAICRALFPTTLLLAALIRQNCISFVYFFLFILYFWIHNRRAAGTESKKMNRC